jgi:hypothetical protein
MRALKLKKETEGKENDVNSDEKAASHCSRLRRAFNCHFSLCP